MHSIQWVIFDCDGVLVDSEPITSRVFATMLQELGLPWDEHRVMRTFVGKTMQDSRGILESALQAPLPSDFLPSFDERMFAALARELSPTPGLLDTLIAIENRRGRSYCVASNGSHEKMELTLGVTGLLPRFENRRFSASDVAKGKPAPDLFLHAARQCGVLPRHCAVVEDSVSGVTAGVAAGMRVFGYAALSDAAALREAGAQAIFRDFAELPGILFDR